MEKYVIQQYASVCPYVVAHLIRK